MATFRHVKGMPELERFFDTAAVRLHREIVPGALRAAAEVIRDEAKRLAPVGPPSAEGVRLYGHYPGALRDSIRVTVEDKKGGRIVATVSAGGMVNGADVWYAHIIEFTGAVAHMIKAGRGRVLMIGRGIFRRRVMHPGMKAQPFLRPALDTTRAAALRAATDYARGELAKNARETELA